MLEGPDIERTNAVAAATDLPIILSGGISSREDIDRVSSQAHPSVRGIVVGKALYAGRIDLAAVLERYAVVDSGTEAREAW
jgi:phosphoribosylformimino-5-aminoimidazole carboxamide ribonucleotide (ProFAR) isomerase